MSLFVVFSAVFYRHIPHGEVLFPLRQGSSRREEGGGQPEGGAGEGGGRGDRDASRDWRGKLAENTIRVRLYGVDAPETAKFGNPGQPYAEVRNEGFWLRWAERTRKKGEEEAQEESLREKKSREESKTFRDSK